VIQTQHLLPIISNHRSQSRSQTVSHSNRGITNYNTVILSIKPTRIQPISKHKRGHLARFGFRSAPTDAKIKLQCVAKGLCLSNI